MYSADPVIHELESRIKSLRNQAHDLRRHLADGQSVKEQLDGIEADILFKEIELGKLHGTWAGGDHA